MEKNSTGLQEALNIDKAYLCSGCKSAFVRRMKCPFDHCGKPPLDHAYPVIYCCPANHCQTKTEPSFHENFCPLRGVGGLVAKAVVPYCVHPLKFRDVIDDNQLPAIVPLHYIPEGRFKPLLEDESTDNQLGIINLPTGCYKWNDLRVCWDVLKFNGKGNFSRRRVFAVQPGGAKCTINIWYSTHMTVARLGRRSFSHHTRINRLHYGLDSSFSQSIEYSEPNQNGESSATFIAPSKPGVHYITQDVSCMDIADIISNQKRPILTNGPDKVIAAIRVLPTEFASSKYVVLPQSLQDQIKAFLTSWMNCQEDHPGAAYSCVPRENMYLICSFLIGLYDGEGE